MIAAALILAAVSPLAGAWALERTDAVLVADGRTVPNEAVDDAAHASGLIVYDPSGWMALQIGAGGRAAEPGGAIGRKRALATGSYYAYYGRYAVDPATATVRHMIANSLMPPEIGIVSVKHYRIDGDRLFLISDPVARPGGERVNRIVFHRLTSTPSTVETGRN